ncbi:MAG: YlbF family regulator [Candidatus Izemoplasmataceae bacterium]
MDKELLDLTYDACDAFKDQSEFQRLLALKEMINHNQDIRKLIMDFNKVKEVYEEAKSYGKYHPDLARYQTDFQKEKIRMMSNDVIKEYKTLERVLQKKLDQFSIALAESVSKNIKHPREMSIINLEES